MKIIIYEELDKSVSILIPFTKELTIKEIGEKDIGIGIPFWIVDNDSLPNTPQETWKLINMGTPSGYGKKI